MEEGEGDAVSTTWRNLTFAELVQENREQFERLDNGEELGPAEECDALAQHWDRFYVKNKAAFFKDRHYFGRDYPELAAVSEEARVCEWGCGVGNTVWGLLGEHPQWSFDAFDCSDAAVALVNDRRDARVRCVVWNPADREAPSPLAAESLDLSLFVFFLSALGEESDLGRVAAACFAATRAGGLAVVRDYALYDMTMLRFARKRGRKLQPRLYRRADGTLARFFETAQIEAAFEAAGFAVVRSGYECRELRNRKTGEKMYRNWVSAIFCKP